MRARTLASTGALSFVLAAGVFVGAGAPLAHADCGGPVPVALYLDVPRSLADSDPCAPPPEDAGVSNVLFIPGTEASRLYYRDGLGIEHQVWDPDLYTDIPYLEFNPDGTSKYALYTKDIVDSIGANNPLESEIRTLFGGDFEVYGKFEQFMDGLVDDGTINEWRAYPYDWRFSVEDVVQKGTATKMPDGSVQQVYLADILKDLASSSQTGRVTIVAHSNGGLVAKALVGNLGSEAGDYIDRIILIGTPQWGTPAAIGAMLHADNFVGLPALVINSAEARRVESTLPGPYELLPSLRYFNAIADPAVTFKQDGLLAGVYANRYGSALGSFSSLDSFLKDTANVDQTGSPSDLHIPLKLPSTLVDDALGFHAGVDATIFPSDIAVTAIAGWGQDTIKTLAYTTGAKVVCGSEGLFSRTGCADVTELEHTAVTTQDGDGTVLSASAVGDVLDRLYFDSFLFNQNEKVIFNHQDLTTAPPIQEAIENLLEGVPGDNEYLVPNKPLDGANPVRLRVSSHSPVNLLITDANGEQSGVLQIPGSDLSGVKQDIPSSSVQVLDDEEYVTVPQDGVYSVVAKGDGQGPTTLQVERVESDGSATTTALFADLPTTASSTVTFLVEGGIPTAPTVDVEGDGGADFSAVSTLALDDPLAYVRYMQTVVKALGLARVPWILLHSSLVSIEYQLAHPSRRAASLLRLQTDLLLRLVKQQEALEVQRQVTGRGGKVGITAPDAEIILDMINRLKTLLP